MKNETAQKSKERPKEEQNSKSRESSIKKGCHCLALRPGMLQIKKPDTDMKTETDHQVKERPKEEQNSKSRESLIKKGCHCLALRPGMLEIKKSDTDMKTETAHQAKERPKEEQNSKSRESSIKKGCHCLLALRPGILQIKKLDTDVKTETAHQAKQRPKEEQSSESRESSVKKGCPCLAIRPGVTSRKVFSVCSSSVSSNLSNTHKQKRVNQGVTSPVQNKKPENWHSPSHYLHTLRQESYLQKSKSRTEDKSSVSSDEKFDLSSSKINQIIPETKQKDIFSKNENLSFRKKGILKKKDCSDKKFKCTLTCLHLPNFSKGKPEPVRPPAVIQQSAISRTVSLERFECKSSWSSSAIVNDIESDGESLRLYFDLPMELIRATFNDANNPVATAFVFDKDLKGGLNDNRVREKGTNSHEAGRHVRFSMSSLES